MRGSEKSSKKRNICNIICDKHAYLIIAHKSDYTLSILLRLIDDERNDIYLHMDKKNKEYNNDWAKKYLKKSKLFYVKRKNIMWGGYSQINAELSLISLSIKNGKYAYYHLLSGEDLPLKNQDTIHRVFNENQGKEFVHIKSFPSDQIDYRLRKYHFFQDRVGRSAQLSFFQKVCKRLNKYSIFLQNSFAIIRNKSIDFSYGSNWFSITDDFARYVVSKSKWIKRHFKYTLCGDEEFLQTVMVTSKYIQKNSYHNFRLIDWQRGRPYVFKTENFDELISSEKLFARKFSSDLDKDIISKLYRYISNKGDNSSDKINA